ncbi:MAG: hypothetical protein EA424_16405, partial [Planctomycetaceae bacterium]
MFGPDETRLERLDSIHYASGAKIADVVLEEAGTYTIRFIERTNRFTGSFSVAVSDQSLAEPVPLPAFNTEITGTLTRLAEVDDYTFTGTAGQVLTFERLGNANISMTLFGPDGHVLTGGGNFDTFLEFVELPEDGEYRLEIRAGGGTESGQLLFTGEYRFVVWTPERAPEPIPIHFGQVQPGQITIRGDVVDFALAVGEEQVGKPVSVVVSNVSNRSSNSFRGRLDLFEPDGTRLQRVDSIHYSHGGRIGDVVLDEAGTYTIRFIERTNRFTGDFSVGVSALPVPEPAPLPGFNQEITGTLTQLAEVEAYQFEGTAGQVLTFERWGSANINMTLYGPDGEVVAGAG